jgi:enoyl-CoA hydratase
MSDAEPAVLVERDGHVVTITLNRPDKRNAFNAEVLCRLCDAWDLIDGDPDVRAAIVTGAGGNFSAGADLDRLVGAMMAGEPAANEFEQRIRDDLSLIYKGFLKEYRTSTPLVGAIEGYCYAGGMEILMAIDVRVAAEDASLAVSEVQRGLFPMAGSTVRLPRQIPYTIAMDMLIVGDALTGQRAYDVGLVGHVAPSGGALAKAREIADRLAANGPLAVRNIKASVLAGEVLREEDAWAREQELGMEVMSSKDAREGPKAFLEKRPANFTGQ